jgi:hypothetical protein
MPDNPAGRLLNENDLENIMDAIGSGGGGGGGTGLPNGGVSGEALLKQSAANGDAGWHPLTKASVGLNNVDNTSDANKPVSTATQTALDNKLDKNQVVVNSVYAKGSLPGTQEMRSIVTAVTSGSTALITSGAVYTGLSGKENTITEGTNAQYYRGDKSWQALNKAAVGLANVDNTSDANKPVSTATQTALNAKADASALAGKENTVTAGTTAQYYRGDKSWQALNKAAVGLNNVDNTSDLNKPISIAVQAALDAKVGSADVSGKLDKDTASTNSVYATGATAGTQTMRSIVATVTSGSTALITSGGVYTELSGKENTVAAGTTAQYYRGDKSWQTLDKAAVGLGNVDNTADTAKPVSTATQTALDTKLDKNTAATNSVYTTGATAGTQTVRGIDTVPAASSTNLITSGGVASAVQYLNGNYVTDTAGSVSGDTFTVTKSYKNASSGAVSTQTETVPLANATNAGLMSPADVAALSSLSIRVSALEGQATKYAVTIPASPSQSNLTTIYRTASNTTTEPVPDGTQLVDTAQGIAYEYFETDSTWHGPLSISVANFTNSSPGLIQGKNADGFVYAENDGTGSVVGWSALNTTVTNLGDNKLDKSTTATSVYATTSAGAQEMRSIVTAVTSGSTALITSGAVYTGLSGKENTVAAGTTAQYYRGDKTWQTLDKAAVGLGNVDNTSDANKPVSIATQTALNAKADASDLSGKLDKDTTATNSVYAKGSAAGTQEMRGIVTAPASGSTALITAGGVYTALSGKVNTNGTDRLMTAAEGTKLGGIETGAQVNVKPDWTAAASTAAEILNKPQNLVQDANYVHTDNNYTTAEKTKLAGLEAVDKPPVLTAKGEVSLADVASVTGVAVTAGSVVNNKIWLSYASVFPTGSTSYDRLITARGLIAASNVPDPRSLVDLTFRARYVDSTSSAIEMVNVGSANRITRVLLTSTGGLVLEISLTGTAASMQASVHAYRTENLVTTTDADYTVLPAPTVLYAAPSGGTIRTDYAVPQNALVLAVETLPAVQQQGILYLVIEETA